MIPDSGLSPFGALLKSFRTRRHLTQQQLAKAVGVHRNAIGRWEQGDFLPENKTLVLELARHLHLNNLESRHLLEASLTAPSPHWSVPLPRNPFFAGREKILETLHTQIGVNHTIALTQSSALHGLGGVGKTQVALEYAYRHALEYSAVFWIGAETAEHIVSGLLRIADVLQLPERRDKDQQYVVTAVQRWLSMHDQWLLIWDNVEDLDLLNHFLPPARQGAILLTTRSQALGTLAQGLDLLPMEQEEGMQFLLSRAKVLAPRATSEQMYQFAANMPTIYAAAEKLVMAMDGLPLALDQAGAYIEETGCSLTDYLQRYPQQRTLLLDRRGTLGGDHPHSVSMTFRLSSERVEREQSAAVDILRVCALLQADAIPEELFLMGAEHLGPEIAPLADNPTQLDQALAVLRSLSLVQRQAETRTLSLHRLLQAVLRERMSEQEQVMWQARLIAALNMLFPGNSSDVHGWYQSERLLPHVLTVATTIPDQAGGMALAQVLQKTANYLDERGQYEQAEELYQRALPILEQLLGLEHPDLASSLNSLAGIQYGQGKYEQAEMRYQRALHILKQVPEPVPSDLASSLNGLADLYQEQGKYEQADSLYRQAWRIGEQMLGLEHPLVAIMLNGLAKLCFRRGRYEEAELLYQRALGIREQILGPQHPDVAGLLHNLATLYKMQGKDEQAQAMFEHALRIWEPKHPNSASSLNGLANLYLRQEKNEQAQVLYEQALHIWEETLGPEHPNVALVLDGLGEIYLRQRKYQQAETFYKQALHIREKTLGPKHPLVTRSLNGLANLYLKQERNKQAQALFEQALRSQEQQLGLHHPETAQTLHDLATLHHKQGNLSVAISLAERALKIRSQSLGDHHPQTTATRMLHAQLLQEQTYTQEENTSEPGPEVPPTKGALLPLQKTVPLSANDPLQAFLAACCELHPLAWCSSADLWQAYKHWVEDHQERYPLSRSAFIAQLKAHGGHADRTKTSRIWRGIALVKKNNDGG